LLLPTVILYILCIAGCTAPKEKKANTVSVETIPIDVRNMVGEGDLSVMVDTGYYEIIPLETNDSCLIAEVTRLYLKDDRIIVYDERAQGAYVFNRKDGSFHARVRAIGQGPGEYPPGINDISVTDNHICVLDPPFGIMLYDFDGQFVKKISLEGTWGVNVFSFDDKNYYLVQDWGNSNGRGLYNLFKIDTEHNRVYSYLPFSQKDLDNRRGWGLNKYYCYNGENKLLFFSTVDTIFRLGDNDEINPAYVIDIVYRKLPQELMTGSGYVAIDRAIEGKYTKGIVDVAETSRFLYLATDGDLYHVVYDKKEKETKAIAVTYRDHVWMTMSIENVFSTEIKDLVLTYVYGEYAYGSKEYVSKMTLTNRFDRDFFEVMKRTDEEANPIVFVLKFLE
jgi:hypothetical protein